MNFFTTWEISKWSVLVGMKKAGKRKEVSVTWYVLAPFGSLAEIFPSSTLSHYFAVDYFGLQSNNLPIVIPSRKETRPVQQRLQKVRSVKNCVIYCYTCYTRKRPARLFFAIFFGDFGP